MTLTFLALLLICTAGSALSNPAGSTELKLSKHPKVLVVSFDGFRYDYMTLTDTPHLDALIAEGVKVPYMQAQFPTKTFPNHQSMATGLYPESHGITDNVLYDPEAGRILNGFEDEPEFWNYSPDVLPIYVRNEEAGDERYSGCFMWAGSSTPYGENSDILPSRWMAYNSSIPWEERVDAVISWLTDEEKPVNLAFLYFNEPDSQGHADGVEDEATLNVIRESDTRAGELVAKLKDAGIYDSVNVIIVSDHGMQTVSSETIIDTTTMANSSLYTNPGGSPVYQIWPEEGVSVETLEDQFKEGAQLNDGTFRVYRKEEMGFVNFTSNRRIAPLILLAQPGYAFEDVEDNLNELGKYGVHGYDNRFPSMFAFFAARGPNFKKGYSSPYPISNLDLVPLISEIIGIPPPPNNGSLANTLSLLEDGETSTSPTTLSTPQPEETSTSPTTPPTPQPGETSTSPTTPPTPQPEETSTSPTTPPTPQPGDTPGGAGSVAASVTLTLAVLAVSALIPHH